MILIILKWELQNISHGVMRIILLVISPILNIFLHSRIILMVLTWPAIQYPIKTSSVLGISSTKLLIPLTDAEVMGVSICIGEVEYP